MALSSASDLGALLHHLRGEYGGRLAAGDKTEDLSFSALDVAADRWAAALQESGYGPGRHVGLLAGNSPTWLAVAFGAWRAGATLVPISTFATARELGEILVHADVDLLVLQPRLRSNDHLEHLHQILPLPRLKQVVTLAPQASPPASAAGDFLGAARRPQADRIDPKSTACVLYTSGTTGRPKGVMLSHAAMLATALPTAERSGLTAADKLLSTLPLFWVAGLAIRALPTLVAGCALLLMESFAAESAIAILERRRPTALHLRPPQVGQILSHPRFQPSLLAQVRKGNGRAEWYGSRLAEDPRFITGYGMTEMAGYVTALDWRDSAEARRNQFGRTLPGVEIRIADDHGSPRAGGDIGEIRVRGPGMFSGYYKEPPRTGLDEDGWFRTGDLGKLDSAGRLHFVGRSKDLLRVKGINVSPLEVEGVLAGHPAVEAAYVVGLPHSSTDQELAALIVARGPQRPAEEELRLLAAETLSHYKRPVHYLFIERSEVPLGGTSKPQRAALAAIAASRLQALR